MVVAVLALCGCGDGGQPLADLGCRGTEPARWSGRVPAGDASLYMLVRGARCDAPVLLWLHGGPGGAERPLFRLYDRDLEDQFVVAYWDQRGAGRSWDREADPAKLTIDQMLADTDAVVDTLRGAYGDEGVALVGHSWGAALALLYAARHPETVAAMVAVNPLIAPTESQRAQLRFLREMAEQNDETELLRELARIGPPPFSGPDALHVEELVGRYGGVFHQAPNLALATLSAVVRGFVSPSEIVRIIRANEATLAAMADDLADLDLRDQIKTLDVPVLFLLGSHDRVLDPGIAQAFLEELDAPHRRAIWFSGSAHNVPFEEPARFVEVVKAFLLSPASADDNRGGHGREEIAN